MTHDPLCVLAQVCPDGVSQDHELCTESSCNKCDAPDTFCVICEESCQCDLIARARLDEHAQIFRYVGAEVERLEALVGKL
jgi:hypothetical protein